MGSSLTGTRLRPGPPRARMAFRVGVVGHRPDRLPADQEGMETIRSRVAEVLSTVAGAVGAFRSSPDASLYSREAPLLRANSPLAEGADRLFAEEALRLGYDLTCVTPFGQAEFEQDFKPPAGFETDSVERFRSILGRAEELGGLTKFELDGDPGRRAEAYQAAGSVVLNQSDLLVVLWDGGGPNGPGGTVETLRRAIGFNVPVLWIDTKPPYGWRLLRTEDDLDCLDFGDSCSVAPAVGGPGCHAGRLSAALSEIVVDELGVPDSGGPHGNSGEARTLLWDYLGETKPRLNLAFLWKLFRDLLDQGRLRLPKLLVTDFVEQISGDWPVDDPSSAVPATYGASWINGVLRPHYAWSDKLADRYADAHRSAFVWTSLLAAAAVFIALLPMAAGWGPHHHARLTLITAATEFVIVGFMLGMPSLAKRWRWHQRWLEYRVLAELIRELRILVPLGGGRPLPRSQPHLSNYGDPARSWMYWQVRAIARATGLPNAIVTPAYVEGQLSHLSAFAGSPAHSQHPDGQIGFHHLNCERLERLHRHLHEGTLFLFTLTICGVVANWTLPLVLGGQVPWVARWLILISAFFPSLGAALASINNQGEFARLQRRSRAMREGFEDLKRRIVTLQGRSAGATLGQVTELAAEMAAMMVDENTDWRIVVLDLPHVAG